MSSRGTIAGLTTLLLALFVAAAGLLAHSHSAPTGPLQGDLQAHHPVAVPAVAQVRTPMPTPDLPDDPGIWSFVCAPVIPEAVSTVSVPSGALVRTHDIISPPSRGPPAAML